MAPRSPPCDADIARLEERLADVLDLPDHFEPKHKFLARFLVAAASDVEAAHTLVCDHVDWRRANQVDELGRAPLESILPQSLSAARMASFFPVLERGVDKLGRPVLYMLASRIDTRAAVKASSADTVIKFQIWQRERSLARLDLFAEENAHRMPPYYTMVLDLAGSSLSQANSEFYSIIRRLMEIDQAHYPGRVGKMVLRFNMS